MIEKTFLSKDGKSTIHYYIWEPEGRPRAVLQIVHGMAEHLLRYADFAEYLNSNGILVCGNDHVGHGRSSAPDDWGYFGEEDGWRVMIQDVEQLHGIMKVQYMDVPYFILGHSMGSFITRAWMSMIGRGADGVIIMGTAGSNSAVGVARTLVSTLRKTQGSRHISRTVTGLAFGSYNKRIKPARTDYDWLTRDNAIVDKYIDDPACGFTFTLAGYSDLFNVISYVSSDNWYKLVPKDLSILIVSGTEDPVGSYGKGPAEVAEKLQDTGSDDVSLILYEDMRHEILNEFGKEAVYEDIRRFILDEALPEDDADEVPAVSEAAGAAEYTAEETAPVADFAQAADEKPAQPAEEPAQPELIIPDFDAGIRASEAATGLGLAADANITAWNSPGGQDPEIKAEKTGLSDFDSDMITNFFRPQAVEKAAQHNADEESAREFDFPEFSRMEEKPELEKVVDSYKANGAEIEYIENNVETVQAEANASENINTVSEETLTYNTEAAERSETVAPLDERVFHDTTPQDDRLNEEKAFDSAEDMSISSPDFSGEEDLNVPHRGIRNVDIDHTVEWVTGESISGTGTESAPEEEYAPAYVQDLYKPQDEDSVLTVDESVFAAALSNDPISPDFSGVETVNVPHRGIRWLVEGYDESYNDPHPVVGPARGVIKRASEKAEELASKYDTPDTSKRIADKADALATKYNG